MRCWPSTPTPSRSTSRHSGPSQSCRSKCCARQLPRQFGGVHRVVARLIYCVWNSLRIYCALYAALRMAVLRTAISAEGALGSLTPVLSWSDYVTQGETTMATPQLTFNTAQTAILMADFHREGMGDNPMVQERGIVQKARAVLEAARQAGVLVVYIVVNFRPGYREISDRDVIFR